MASSYALEHQTALVTGASRGLGLEIARKLIACGVRVAMVARDAEALEQAAQSVSGLAVSADLSDIRQVDNAALKVLREFGSVDILINNAAIQGPIGPLEQVNLADWTPVIATNLLAPMRLIQHVLPGMKSKGRGKIINLSGGGATGPRPDFTAYAATKVALVRLTETLAVELKDHKIDVNSIAPGAMNTRMLQETIEAGRASREYDAAVERAQAGGDSPEKAAELIAFLCSRECDGITGRLISAPWDDWRSLPKRKDELATSDVYTLRRIVPKDRGLNW